jgi:hypothetical protein
MFRLLSEAVAECRQCRRMGSERAVRETASAVRRVWICHGFDASGDTMAEETAGQIVAWRGVGSVVDIDGGESHGFRIRHG